MKICTKCGEEKPLDLFYKRLHLVDKWYAECKACKRAHDNAHNAKLEVKVSRSAYHKNRRLDPEVIEKEHAYKYAYHRTDAYREVKREEQRVRRLNPDVLAKERERGALYAKDNPHLFAAKTRKRKSAKLQRTPSWLTDEHHKQISMFYWEAAEVSKLVGEFHTVDHIIPLQGKTVSGLHVPWNLQILTKSENSAKGNRL